MDVIEIGIPQMHENPAGRRVSGVVSLLVGGRHVLVQCETSLPESGRSRAALIREAFRQFQRMPENKRTPLAPCRLVPARRDA